MVNIHVPETDPATDHKPLFLLFMNNLRFSITYPATFQVKAEKGENVVSLEETGVILPGLVVDDLRWRRGTLVEERKLTLYN